MKPSRIAVAAAFAAIYLLWGGTFLAIRYAVAEVPPLLTIAVRCLGGAAGVVGLVVVWRMKESANRPLPGAPAIPVPGEETGRPPRAREDGPAGSRPTQGNVRRLPGES